MEACISVLPLCNCPLPFFLALFCTVTKFGLKKTEELISGLVYCPNASKQQHGEQYGSECEVLRKQGEGKGRESIFAALVQMHVRLCSGTMLLHLYACTAGV